MSGEEEDEEEKGCCYVWKRQGRGVAMNERRRGFIVRKSGGGAFMYSGGQRRVVTLSSLRQASVVTVVHALRDSVWASAALSARRNHKVSHQVVSFAHRRCFEGFRNIDCGYLYCCVVWLCAQQLCVCVGMGARA